MKYKKKIYLEAKSFDKQVLKRKKFGLLPDIRKLKKNYNFYNNPWREPEFYKIQWLKIINKIIKISSNKKKNHILEIGCGTGFLSLELARAGNNVRGIDVSKKSIQEANHNLHKVKKNEKLNLIFEVQDANYINKEKKYDTVIFFRSLHHFSNVSKLLNQISKIINKNGILIICEPMRQNFNKLNSIFSLIFRLVLETWEPFKEKIPSKINYKFFKNYEKIITNEYTYKSKKNSYIQSPMDNSTDDPDKVLKIVKRYFKIKKLEFYDGFIDKLIGGLRGKNRFMIAKLLKEFDNYLISEKVLKGTTLYLIAKKK